MTGRPTKYNPDVAKKITDALEAGNTRRASALNAGICEDTLGNWIKRYSDFSALVEKSESNAEVSHVLNIRQAAQAGNWTASAWWLERRRHQDWGRKERVEIVNTVRQLAEAEGLTEEETAAAVAEAESYLKGMRRGSRV